MGPRLLLPFSLVVALLAGCSTSPPHPEESAPSKKVALTPEEWREAYERGAEDAYADVKGRERALHGFVWEPSLVECGVRVPAGVMAGAFYPAHDTCVVTSPGRYVLDSPNPRVSVGTPANER